MGCDRSFALVPIDSNRRKPSIVPVPGPLNRAGKAQLRKSLTLSQRESFASALMTGSFDQYVNAFAVFLGATSVQIGWLTALPQLLGGLFQLIAVWFGQWVHRHRLIVISAAVQSMALVLVALLAIPNLFDKPISTLLLALAARFRSAAAACSLALSLHSPRRMAMCSVMPAPAILVLR